MFRSGFDSTNRPAVADSSEKNFELVRHANKPLESKLQYLYHQDPCAFSKEVILVYKLFHNNKAEFDTFQLAEINKVKQLVMFRQLVASASDNIKHIAMQTFISQYLEAVIKTFFIGGALTTIQAILKIAEIKIKIGHSSQLDSLSTLNVKVELPKIVSKPPLQTHQDIMNLIASNMQRNRANLMETNTETFTYMPGQSVVHYDRPFLNTTIEQIINYERFLNRNSLEAGIKFEQYTKKTIV